MGTELLPGDVAQAILGQAATEQTLSALRVKLGLNVPAPVRYFEWVVAVIHGNLGISLTSSQPVQKIVASRVWNTLTLAGVAAVIVVPLSLALGLLCAIHPRSMFNRVVSTATLMSVSAPEFLIATLLVTLFSVYLRWLPAVSMVAFVTNFGELGRALALPTITLICMVVAPMTRMTRSAIRSVLGSPAIEMALLKGMPRHRVILRHALPNAVGPIVNVVAMNLAYLVSGVVVVEVIFAYPGLAKLMVDAVSSRDLPLIQACALFFCSIYVVLNITADVISLAANPKQRKRS